jgi:hypothetical protein
MAARKAPKNGRPWTPEKVRQRIRVGLLKSRLERQALGTLKADAKAAGNRPMDAIQLRAAMYLVDKVIPNAQAAIDVTLGGTIIVEERDPTARPNGYQRRRLPAA